MASMWFLFVDGSSHHGLTQSLMLTAFSGLEQHCLLWFMLNGNVDCQCRRSSNLTFVKFREMRCCEGTGVGKACTFSPLVAIYHHWDTLRLGSRQDFHFFLCALQWGDVAKKANRLHLHHWHSQCLNSCTSLLSITNNRTWQDFAQASTKTPSLLAKPRKQIRLL